MNVFGFLLGVCQVIVHSSESGAGAFVSATSGLVVGVLGTLAWLRNRETVIVKFNILTSADTIPAMGDIGPTPGIYLINRKRHAIRIEEIWAESIDSRWWMREWPKWWLRSGERLQYVEFRNTETEIETPMQNKTLVRWEKEWPRTVPHDEHYAFPTINWMGLGEVKFLRGVVRYDLDREKRSKKFRTSDYNTGPIFQGKRHS